MNVECDVCSRETENNDDRFLEFGAVFQEPAPDGTFTVVCKQCLVCFADLSVAQRRETFKHPIFGDSILGTTGSFTAAEWSDRTRFWDVDQRFTMRCIAALIPTLVHKNAILLERASDTEVVEFGKGKIAFFAKQRALGLVGRAQLRHTVEMTATIMPHAPFFLDAHCSVRRTDDETSVRMLCANCLKEEEIARAFPMCSRCHVVYYCNATCQRAHWIKHKKVCHRV